MSILFTAFAMIATGQVQLPPAPPVEQKLAAPAPRRDERKGR